MGYDIDKVVERLKKEAWSLGSDDVIEHYCVDLVDAIEIVKAEQEEAAEAKLAEMEGMNE